MSTKVGQVIILPGSSFNAYCADGLSSFDKANIKHLFNFGGNIKMIDCGAENEWIAFNMASEDAGFMLNRMTNNGS